MSASSPLTSRVGARLLLLAGLALAALPRVAPAIDWGSADWGGYSVNSLSYWSYAEMTRRSAKQAQKAARAKGRSTATPKAKPAAPNTARNALSTGGMADERGIEQLARLYPREEFAERKQQFRQIVTGFNQSVQKLYGVAPNNLATALTVALAGSYAAYQNQPFPDPWIKPLHRQMETLLLNDPRLGERAPAQKAGDYQVLVGTGMMLLLAQAELQQSPSPAGQRQLRQAGEEALNALLQIDLDRVDFTDQGIQVR